MREKEEEEIDKVRLALENYESESKRWRKPGGNERRRRREEGKGRREGLKKRVGGRERGRLKDATAPLCLMMSFQHVFSLEFTCMYMNLCMCVYICMYHATYALKQGSTEHMKKRMIQYNPS